MAEIDAASTSSRRRRPIAMVALSMGLVVVALVVVLATRDPASVRAADSPLLGRPAPDFVARTIDGESFRLSDFSGRWVLVNFFATWCVPCIKEHPELIQFDERHRAQGDAAVVGVVYDDSADAARQFRSERGGGWPMVEDPRGRIALEFGVAGVPESFLIAPNGVIATRLLGGVQSAYLDGLLVDAQAQFQRQEPERQDNG